MPPHSSGPPERSHTPPTVSWIAAAHLLRPQGRRGELLAEPLTDLPGVLAPDRKLTLVASGQTSPGPDSPLLRVESVWSPTGKNAGRLVLKLAGCDSISEAEALAGPPPGKDLLLRSTELPPLDSDTFFVGDLLGCALYNGAVRAGTVVDVHFATAPDGRTRLEDSAPLLAVELDAHPLAAEPSSALSSSAPSEAAASTPAASTPAASHPAARDPSAGGVTPDPAGDAAPEHPAEAAPERPADAAPEHPADAAPEHPADAAPERPDAEAASEPPAEAASKHPADAAPEPVLVPFVRAWLESVDLAARRIVMHLPPGLLD